MASAIGVSKASICKWENDKVRPRKNRMAALAANLDVSLSFMTGHGSQDTTGFMQDELAASSRANLKQTIEDCKTIISRTAGVAPGMVTVTISV